jgi:phage terminase large subunit-like protein
VTITERINPTLLRDPARASFAAIVAEELKSRWSMQARESQLPPQWRWFIWLLLGGRGSGKTRAAAEWVRWKIKTEQCHRIGFASPTINDYQETMIEGPSGLLAVHRHDPKQWQPNYQVSRKKVIYPNGATILLYSAERPERSNGPNLDGLWIDELGLWDNVDLYNELMMALRIGPLPQCVISTTPKPKAEALALLKSLIERSKQPGTDVAFTRMTTEENKRNLSAHFMTSVVEPLRLTRKGRAQLDADIAALEEREGALWSSDLIDETRITPEQCPDLTKVVVAIDPSTSSKGKYAGECGIVVVGRDRFAQGYVLADYSIKGTPEKWAERAVFAYHQFQANMLVAEKNQGGEMIRSVISQVEGAPFVKLVNATRNKHTRAEPVSLVYTQRRFHHVGHFPDLEDQMVSWEPNDAESPDRLDALVWGAYEVLGLELIVAKKPLPAAFAQRKVKSGWTTLTPKERARPFVRTGKRR